MSKNEQTADHFTITAPKQKALIIAWQKEDMGQVRAAAELRYMELQLLTFLNYCANEPTPETCSNVIRLISNTMEMMPHHLLISESSRLADDAWAQHEEDEKARSQEDGS